MGGGRRKEKRERKDVKKAIATQFRRSREGDYFLTPDEQLQNMVGPVTVVYLEAVRLITALDLGQGKKRERERLI